MRDTPQTKNRAVTTPGPSQGIRRSTRAVKKRDRRPGIFTPRNRPSRDRRRWPTTSTGVMRPRSSRSWKKPMAHRIGFSTQDHLEGIAEEVRLFESQEVFYVVSPTSLGFGHRLEPPL